MVDRLPPEDAEQDAPNLLPRRPHELGDEWVYGPNGDKYWGRFGAAGLLAWHRELGVLLQKRAIWSHFGGTWGLPGGARKQHESAADGAMREAFEEATVPLKVLRVIHESTFDAGFWTYTTVIAEAMEPFVPVIADAESAALQWVPLDEVEGLALHPGFASSWPELRAYLV